MSNLNPVDIAIIGAGPAGVCAALRLQQLGYRVQLIERSAVWPRPQIGEALTPGIKNIIELLDANHVLESVPLLTRLPTRLCWRSRSPELVSHQDAAIVDRGAFDAALLELARVRGILVAQPAGVTAIHGSAGNWQLHLQTPGGAQQVQARFILDAHGRAKGNEKGNARQIACAPRLIALWAELEKPDVPSAMTSLTQVEALEHGWLWSSALPGQRLRVMLLCDPASLHQFAPGEPLRWLRQQCAQSQLFADVANAPFSAIKACSATPYVDCGSWQEGRLKVGDAAFALDPVSSSGVEKAMRFSLQAVVAIHTAIDSMGQALARDFFQHRLVETCARHTLWTRGYYGQAWCADRPFWQERAAPFAGLFAADESLAAADADAAADPARSMLAALKREMTALGGFQAGQAVQATLSALSASPKPRIALPALRLQQQIRLHEAVQIVDMPCVVADRVQLCRALSHPQLERPLAFLENEALLPPLDILRHHPTLETVLTVLGRNMAQPKAQRLLGWLWQRGLVEAVP